MESDSTRIGWTPRQNRLHAYAESGHGIMEQWGLVHSVDSNLRFVVSVGREGNFAQACTWSHLQSCTWRPQALSSIYFIKSLAKFAWTCLEPSSAPQPRTAQFYLYLKPPYQRTLAETAQTDNNVGAFVIRIGFWGPLYYTYNKKPPK